MGRTEEARTQLGAKLLVSRKHDKNTSLFLRGSFLCVMQVDLPGSVLRSMAAMLDLDSNEDAFDASVATIADKNPRYKKYIGRVCDDIRDLKVSKKVPVVFVYSVKDEMFKIFF